jgi:malonate transporter and related proteins
MNAFLQNLALAAPMFVLVLAGWLLAHTPRFNDVVADALNKFVFAVALPALLFPMMADLSRLPAVDARLLAAYFGGCLVVFAIGRLLGWTAFRLDGVAQSVFALGGVFSNTVLLGVPIAKLALGDAALPSVALVIVFNALVLWTLVTVSVEWARHGQMSVRGFATTAKSVVTNPIVASIVGGFLFGLTGLTLPTLVAEPLRLAGQAAAPMALVVLGMGLAQYAVRDGWPVGLAVTVLKLVVHPLVVWGLALALGLPPIETQAVVLLASLAVGVNVYLMSNEFKALQGPVAASLVLSTLLGAITTPLVLTLIGTAALPAR